MGPRITDSATCGITARPQATLEPVRKAAVSERVEPAVDADELGYDPIPPNRRITVFVRYRIRGRGQPLAYLVDE